MNDASERSAPYVRASEGRTRAETTARMRFVASQTQVMPSLEERLGARWRPVERSMRSWKKLGREVLARREMSELARAPGRIDFVHNRSLYDAGGGQWTLLSAGREFTGCPGAWEMLSRDEDFLERDDPFWLLALVVGVIEAHEVEGESVAGLPCRHYRAIVSGSAAVRSTPLRLDLPVASTLSTLRGCQLTCG